jgi:hypothetical protein
MAAPRYIWRALVPVFLFQGTPMAWQCAGCGKRFSVSPEEALAARGHGVPVDIETEFNLHSCELLLRAVGSGGEAV